MSKTAITFYICLPKCHQVIFLSHDTTMFSVFFFPQFVTEWWYNLLLLVTT